MNRTGIITLILTLFMLNQLAGQGWRRNFTNDGNITLDNTGSTIQAPDSGYLSVIRGYSNGKVVMVLRKINEKGLFEWSKIIQDNSQISKYILPKIQVLYDQSYLITAPTTTDSLVLVRVDVLGNILFSNSMSRFDAYDAIANDSGILLIHTDFYGKFVIEQHDLNLNLLWQKKYDVPQNFQAEGLIWVDADQFIYFSADDWNNTNSNSNVMIYKLTPAGDLVWTKSFVNNEPNQHNTSLFVNSAQEIYYLINFEYNLGANFTAVNKFDSNGVFLWKRILSAEAESSKPTPDGGLAVLSYDFTIFPSNSILRKLDSQGDIVLNKIYKTSLFTALRGNDVALTNDGGYILSCRDDTYSCTYIKTDSLGRIYPNFINGTASFDLNNNCLNDSTETPLKNWIVSAENANGAVSYTVTDTSGYFEMNVDTGQYTVKIQTLGPIWEACNNGTYQADLSAIFDTAVIVIPVQATAYCSLLNVNISTPRIRRCFNNTYWLNWQNNGTAAAENVQIDVVLPPELDFVAADPLQPTVIGDTLRFSIGTVSFGASGTMSLIVYADCDSTVLGQTLCVEAWIRPDTLCYDIPNWSGAEVIANAHCTSDTTVQYTLKNVGNGPTGDLNYIITEDLVVLMTQPFNLNPNQEIQINQAFSGNLQRIIAEQAPNYPFDPVSAAAVETCGGSTNGLGQINQFPLNDGSPFVDIECATVVGSYDPNDKTGFPLGYGPDHLIEANTDLTYLIRFQNTGTDTAFRVVVRDTLSQWLDVVSVQPGPASHPYRWNYEDGNVLAFHFDPITLPDSNVNQEASNGFVQFRIKQKPNLADGTEINNTADIYFDYNEAVRTNTTMHRIGKFEYTVSVFPEPSVSSMPVTVSPNPFSTQTTLRLGRAQAGDLTFELYDQQGRLVRAAAFKGGQYELSAEGLRGGMYTYVLKDTRGAVQGRGKMIVSAK